ncbi:hypothetical protein ACP4OV_015167 [Aristida adscensionis]
MFCNAECPPLHAGGHFAGVRCVLSSFRVHPHRLLAYLPYGARLCGSYDGAWLFLASDQSIGHELINVRTGETHRLPEWIHYDLGVDGGERRLHRIAYLAGTLSCQPGDWGSIGGAVFGAEEGPAFQAEDVLYHAQDHTFYFLTGGEHVFIATPVRLPGGGLRIDWARRYYEAGREYQHHPAAAYIVLSDEDLLMVVRFKATAEDPTTSSFRVFVFSVVEGEGTGDNAAWVWTELPTLGGRILFLGRGCSRSYHAGSYPGCDEGVYFLDDNKEDLDMMFEDRRERLYSGFDNGRWSLPRAALRCASLQIFRPARCTRRRRGCSPETTCA